MKERKKERKLKKRVTYLSRFVVKPKQQQQTSNDTIGKMAIMLPDQTRPVKPTILWSQEWNVWEIEGTSISVFNASINEKKISVKGLL